MREHGFYRNTTDYNIAGHARRHHFGAAPAAAPRPVSPTITRQAAGLINTAAIPVRWAFGTAGNLAHYLGNTLAMIGRKL